MASVMSIKAVTNGRGKPKMLSLMLYKFDTALGLLAKRWKIKINYSFDMEDIFDENQTKSFVVFEGLSPERANLSDGSAYFFIRTKFVKPLRPVYFSEIVKTAVLTNPVKDAINSAFFRFVDKFESDRTHCTVGEFFEMVGESIVDAFKMVMRKIYLEGEFSWSRAC